MQSPSTSMQRGSLPKTLCLSTIWLGSSRPPRMLRFAMGIEQLSSLNRPFDSLAARIPIICAPLRLLSQRAAVSPRRKKLLGRHCKRPRGAATPLWPTRFRMKSHSTSWACPITSKARRAFNERRFLNRRRHENQQAVVHGIFALIHDDLSDRWKTTTWTASAHSEKQNGRAL